MTWALRIRRGAAVVAVVFAAVAALGAATAEGSSTNIGWGKCDRQFQCGTLQVPLLSFPPGDYRLEIKITDKPSGKTVTQNVNFSVAAS